MARWGSASPRNEVTWPQQRRNREGSITGGSALRAAEALCPSSASDRISAGAGAGYLLRIRVRCWRISSAYSSQACFVRQGLFAPFVSGSQICPANLGGDVLFRAAGPSASVRGGNRAGLGDLFAGPTFGSVLDARLVLWSSDLADNRRAEGAGRYASSFASRLVPLLGFHTGTGRMTRASS